MKRMVWVDAARGAAVLLVILGHILPRSAGKAWIYSFNIPFFFVLSGYLLAACPSWQKQELSTLFRRKARGLMYPYLTFSGATILLQLILGQFQTAAISGVFTVFLFGAQALWFLPALFFGELLVTAALKKCSGRGRLLLFLAAAVISTAVCQLFHPAEDAGLIGKVINNEIILLNRILLACVWIGIGFAAAPVLERVGSGRRALFLAAALAAVNFLGARHNFGDICENVIGNPVLFYLNGISGSFSILLLFRVVGDRCRFLPYCGRNSLILFATHQNLNIIEIKRAELSSAASFALTVAIELLLVAVIRRFLPFMLTPMGKKSQQVL